MKHKKKGKGNKRTQKKEEIWTNVDIINSNIKNINLMIDIIKFKINFGYIFGGSNE